MSTSFDLASPSGAWLVMFLWFLPLRYRHCEKTHAEILRSLDWPEMEMIFAAACSDEISIGEFEIFAAGVRRQAQLARDRGLVRPDGERRRSGGGRKPKMQMKGGRRG